MSSDSSEPPAAPERRSKAAAVLEIIASSVVLYLIPLAIAAYVLVVGVLLSPLPPEQTDQWFETATLAQFLYMLLTELVIIGMLVLFMKMAGETWQSIAVRRPKWRHLLSMLAGALLYYGLYILVASVADALLPIDFEQQQEIGFDTGVRGIELGLVFLSLVVVAPLAEEILFRGYLYTRLRRAFSVIGAALLVSVLFAAVHLQFETGKPLLWAAALDTFVLSLVLVYLREKTGNIWAGVGVHALKNLVAFTVLFELIHIPGV